MEHVYNLEFKHYDNYKGGGCRLYVNGQLAKGCTATGCGYDREGAAFGNWIQNTFQDLLRENFAKEISEAKEPAKGEYLYQPINKYYGANITMTKGGKIIHLDGACGKSSMQRILEAIGGKYEYVPNRSKWSNFARVSF